MDDPPTHAVHWPQVASIPPVVDEFFNPGEYSTIPLVLLHERVIGRLRDSVAEAIGLDSGAREVKVGAAVQLHIFKQRQVAGVDDVMVCLNRLDEGFAHLVHLITEKSHGATFPLVGALPSIDRFINLPIKLVPRVRAASGEDELWLRTAHPLGKGTRRRLLKQGKLLDLPAV